MQTMDQAFEKLSHSRFRSRFHLDASDRAYIERVGMDAIRRHACQFIKERLAPAVIVNDGKQTPMKGHPVFKAQHACACCCRGCLNKWYHVKPGVELSSVQQEKIVNFLMEWIRRQMEDKLV